MAVHVANHAMTRGYASKETRLRGYRRWGLRGRASAANLVLEDLAHPKLITELTIDAERISPGPFDLKA